MSDLERRALLGDWQAQNECTQREIILPCPKCFGMVKPSGTENWSTVLYGRPRLKNQYEFNCECGLSFSTYEYSFRDALADWNTRTAPPIGQCNACIHYHEGTCLKIYDDGACSEYAIQNRNPSDFCNYFKSKEE